jgi:hypothetical protein
MVGKKKAKLSFLAIIWKAIFTFEGNQIFLFRPIL